MKISTRVRYGIKALAYIAKKTKNNELVRIKEISMSENISPQYLEQILHKFKNANIIEGKRGPNGGYKLSFNPSNITLHQIYKILDEDEKLVDCNEHDGLCITAIIDEKCSDECVWSKLDTAVTKILDETTLEEIIKKEEKV